ncbi:uncharacterized protein LOC119077701 [Bradysia coprophila]|uniref:uncharacterized protein LOC119077701 n=1 Tax=Bradysia coprophila TaxID=38358 RepID=UPI00187DC303|nr:uncharacterized protein LOC119077701 [Bradysia coprophila]
MCDYENDILVELSNDDIEAYRVFYKSLKNIEYVYVHLYLKNQLRWNILMREYTEQEKNAISDRCKMRFYRHRNGNSEWKTIIGLTGDKEYTMFVMTLEESLSELRECLEQSKIIKWHQLPLCVAIHERFQAVMFAEFAKRQLNVRFNNRCTTFWMDQGRASSVDYTVPSDVELKKLNVSDYVQMNETWPYKYPGSEIFIRSLIQLNGGLGVYLSGELITWMLHIECFGIGLLQTVEQHQGKGYARLLTRALTQLVSKKYNEDVILFASHGKPKTVELYHRYGFQHVSFTHWFYLEHIRSNGES